MDNKALLQPQPQQVVVGGAVPVVQAAPIALDGSLLNCECLCLVGHTVYPPAVVLGSARRAPRPQANSRLAFCVAQSVLAPCE
eukprot:COSAG02_NODE_5093_length_4639_cov_2.632599_6_plen_83_part_00